MPAAQASRFEVKRRPVDHLHDAYSSSLWTPSWAAAKYLTVALDKACVWKHVIYRIAGCEGWLGFVA